MNLVDKIPIKNEHRWEITKIGAMFKVVVFHYLNDEKLVEAVDDTLTTALFMAHNKLQMR